MFALLFKAFLFCVVMGMTLFSYFSILTFSLSDHIRNNILSKVTPHTVNQAKEVLSYPIHIDKHIFRQTHALALEMSCAIGGGGYKAHSPPSCFFSPKYGWPILPSRPISFASVGTPKNCLSHLGPHHLMNMESLLLGTIK